MGGRSKPAVGAENFSDRAALPFAVFQHNCRTGVTQAKPNAADHANVVEGRRDDAALRDFEYEQTKLRIEELREKPIAGKFDLEHLKAIHAHVFQDVYEWAGTTRGDDLTLEGQRETQPVQLIKGQTYFEEGPKVNTKLDSVFEKLAEQDQLRGLSREDFSRQAADVMSDLNQVHPFREGNGRTQREFMTQLAEQAGHPLQFEGVTSSA